MCIASLTALSQHAQQLLITILDCRSSRAGLTTSGTSLTAGMAIPTGELLSLHLAVVAGPNSYLM